MFPQGVPGIGLALLRLGVGLGVADLAGTASWSGRNLAFAILFGCLLGGVVTPLCSALAIAWAASSLLGLGLSFPVLVLILNALALASIGPGAYSVDARLFGRRLLVHASPPRRP